ncbi:hypothetical protein PWEIH_03536 [Listeria weihenstephanensis FSL R9-0317]|uniref:membrane lipoprotein lipid attachment site-containing protein n=1 Tax=Listeria weihenstephanensis TaxID=1006155 RepID=UPI0003E8BFCA|nr:membrane lipoprotein lipid attachment site-containing protein [Listeria weihenstephanensis]EUJ40597.1 hypothetical protein PWEIH_03536 [Listeria weihenstephanensis FSL R9-0317]
MVKKIVCILFLILILTGCSNQSEASSERMSEKQETIKIELSTVLGKNGSIVEGNARNGNTIILGNDTEIGSFDFIEKKYTKYFDVSYGNEGDSVVDISASFQDDRYLVITQFQKRSINSQILWPKTYYVYDKGKNKLVETIENPIEISDDKKKLEGTHHYRCSKIINLSWSFKNRQLVSYRYISLIVPLKPL